MVSSEVVAEDILGDIRASAYWLEYAELAPMARLLCPCPQRLNIKYAPIPPRGPSRLLVYGLIALVRIE